MKQPATQRIEGKFRQIEVTHYFNRETGLNVIFHKDNSTFISGWLLNEHQFVNMVKRGELQMENFKYWENYRLYVDLMKKFVDKKISGTEFSDQFFQMWKSDRDKTYNSEELTENFKLTEIDGFVSLISDLFLDCEVFEADPLLREDYEISEEELRDCVKKTLLKIDS